MAYEMLFNRPILALDYKVAAWTDATEQYGTPVVSKALQSVEMEPIMATDEGRVGGAVEHSLAIIEGFELTLSELGFDIATMAIMTPMTHALSGSGVSGRRTLTIPTGSNFPYFGMIARIALDGGGQLHVGFPRCKVMNHFAIDAAESGEFSIPEIEITAARLRLSDDSTKNAVVMDFFAQETAISSDFNVWFGVS